VKLKLIKIYKLCKNPASFGQSIKRTHQAW